MENGVNFESFSKAKYKEGTKYQCTNVAELCIFSVKSTLLAVSHPFQTSDRVWNTLKFCHSLNRYRCYMLTLQALTHTEDPEYEPAGPFGTMPQEPWHPNRTRRNTKPVPWSSSHTAKCSHLCKLENSQNSGELRPPREILPSIKTNYHVLTYLQLNYWMTLILC